MGNCLPHPDRRSDTRMPALHSEPICTCCFSEGEVDPVAGGFSTSRSCTWRPMCSSLTSPAGVASGCKFLPMPRRSISRPIGSAKSYPLPPAASIVFENSRGICVIAWGTPGSSIHRRRHSRSIDWRMNGGFSFPPMKEQTRSEQNRSTPWRSSSARCGPMRAEASQSELEHSSELTQNLRAELDRTGMPRMLGHLN